MIRTLFAIALLSLAFAVVACGAQQTAAPTASQPPPPDCGKDDSTWFCGNVGDRYEGKGAPGKQKDVTSCKALSGENKHFRLSKDIGTDPAKTCLELEGASLDVDLNGHTVTGRITAAGGDISGLNLYGGTVRCAWLDKGSNSGCIRLEYEGIQWEPIRLHHLTIANAAEKLTETVRGIHVDTNAAAYQGKGKALRFDHITMSSSTAPTSRRWPMINVNNSTGGMEADHNLLTCSADTSACQGIVAWATPGAIMHNNLIDMKQNLTAQNGRAFLCDADGAPPERSSNHCGVYDNTIITNNNRAFRQRRSREMRFHHNRVLNISGPDSGAIHLGDNTDGTDILDADVQVYQNLFTVADGTVVMARNVSGVRIYDNEITCVDAIKCEKATFAQVRTAIPPGKISIVSLEKNRGVTMPSVVEAGAEIQHCKSGVVTGVGKSTPVECE